MDNPMFRGVGQLQAAMYLLENVVVTNAEARAFLEDGRNKIRKALNAEWDKAVEGTKEGA